MGNIITEHQKLIPFLNDLISHLFSGYPEVIEQYQIQSEEEQMQQVEDTYKQFFGDT